MAMMTDPFNAATTASAAWSTVEMASSVTINRMRSIRSAINPPNGLATSAHRNRVIDAAATQAGECVALKTNTTSATLYAHEPLIEIASPETRRR